MINSILTRFILIYCLCTSMMIAKAQYVAIPDSNFANCLISSGWGSCLSGNSTSGWLLDTTCSQNGPTSAITCYGLGIHDLTGIKFCNVTYLDVSYNNLTAIDLPPIYEVECHHNQLTHISFDSATEILYCNNNNLDSITSFPTSLTILNCDSNNLTMIPAPSSRNYYVNLSCAHNRLDTITPQIYFGNANSGRPYFNCSHNLIRSMPNNNGFSQPYFFSYINCGYNQITDIDMSWQGDSFICNNNLLTQLSIGGDFLDCSNNNLSSLSSTYYTTYLNCSGNRLTSIPPLPQTLKSLICSRNNLTSLPTLTDSLSLLDCHSNPFLYCLPRLYPSLDSLYLDSTGISCLPNRVSPHSFDINPASLPLCAPASGCDFYYIISGNIHSDTLSACSLDSASPGPSIVNAKVQLLKSGNVVQQMYSNSTGEFTFAIDSIGSYTVNVDTAGLPFSFACPASGAIIDNISLNDTVDVINNFGLACTNVDYAAMSVSTPYIHPFRTSLVTMVDFSIGNIASALYKAKCLGGVSGTVTTIFSGAVSYVGPAPGALIPSVISGDTLQYYLNDLDYLQQGSLDILFNTDSNAMVGSSVCITSIISPSIADINPADDTLTQCFVVHDSHDPNLKEVYPIANIDTGAAKWFTYTVHFQNTGNDTAFTVIVKDTLSLNVDASTFQYLASSTKSIIQLNGPAIVFTFPNINLPDSAENPLGSQGWIQYKVKTRPNLPVGAEIKNTAYIYFDNNSAIVTNTTINSVGISSGIANIANSSTIHLFPNPNKGSFTLQTSGSTNTDYTISDMLGHVITQQIILSDSQQIDLPEAEEGVYSLSVKGAPPIRFVVVR